MIRSPLWREFESGDGFSVRALRAVVFACGVVFLGFSATLGLNWQAQLFLAALMLVFALWVNRASGSHVVTLTLVLLSVYSTVRYGFWRFSTVKAFFGASEMRGWADALFVGLLLLAETYAFVVLALGYFQALWPLRRSPVPLPEDPADWPDVDLLIPTLNEPLGIVRFTALAAMNIDWPTEKLHVYILDDGEREEFRVFAEEAGIGYIARSEHADAKAGNLNHALRQLASPFVAVFDCDHVPTRSFLQLTMGWLLRDLKLAVVQTPHHYYSADPYERNLDQFQRTPGEDELYYGVVQDGNDLWNATSFCGSCAVLRRSALDEVGGLAVETVTEDAHTSLRLQRRGWNTAYINIPQAAGLATERLSAHIRQRTRWARGMVQTLRIENPLFAGGLRLSQRLCYLNAMLHFLFALPRMIFLLAPLIYLVFGRTSIPGYWLAIVAYAAPHLVLSSVTHSRIQGRYRHAFWDQIYETVLAPYLLLPSLLALVHPKLGRFNVTAKGGVVTRDFFDSRIARPFLVLMAFNVFGLFCAAARLIRFPAFAVAGWLQFVNWPARLYDPAHRGAIAINVVWALFNLMLLGVATAVARESQQRREAVRVTVAVPSDVVLPDGSILQGVTADLSSGGVRARLDSAVRLQAGDPLQFLFPVLDGTATLPAVVVETNGCELRARFTDLSLQEEEALATLLYSRADAWLGEGREGPGDRPLASLAHVLRLSARGFAVSVGAWRGDGGRRKARLVASVTPVLIAALLVGHALRVVRAAGQEGAGGSSMTGSAESGKSVGAARDFKESFSLAQAGAVGGIELRGTHAVRPVVFTVTPGKAVRKATLTLRYSASPGLLANVSQLKVSLNKRLVSTLPLGGARAGEVLETALQLPVEVLGRKNELSFEFVGHYTLQCEDPTNSTLWSWIDAGSTVELGGTEVAPTNDLSTLPLPFFDPDAMADSRVQVVFLSQPSVKAMQAAGIVASWLGTLGGSKPVEFQASAGAVHAGNAIVIADDPAQVRAVFGEVPGGATIVMRDNPSDAGSSVLLVAGDNGEDLLAAARALALHDGGWRGAQKLVREGVMPVPRGTDDAPRWLSTERNTPIGEIAAVGDLQSDGSAPVRVKMNLPPDLDFGDRKNLPLHLDYRYNGVPLGGASTLQVYMNGAYVSSTPMPHTDGASEVLETVVPIPVADLRPLENALEFRFVFHPAAMGACAGGAPGNLQGAVVRDSYLDLAGIPRAALLPNLRLFASAGYPFTRKADLDDTQVVLPEEPTAGELETFLAMLGRFGAETGYPALRVSVTNRLSEAAKDTLVIETAGDLAAQKALNEALPVGIGAEGLEVRDLGSMLERTARWRARSSEQGSAGGLVTGAEIPDALVEGMEWPRGSGRSAVVIALRDEEAASGFLAALAGPQSEGIAQSVSVLNGAGFVSYGMGRDFYRVGDTSLVGRVGTGLAELPWLLAVGTVLFCFLLATLMQASLRRRARMRLQGAA